MSIRHPNSYEESQEWLAKCAGILRQYNNESGWGAHWILLGKQAQNILYWMNNYPVYNDSEIQKATQQLLDASKAMQEARDNFIAVASQMKDAE